MTTLLHQDIKGYELLEILGEGGFGAVYRAYQALVKREVAIKVILPEYANQPDFVRRFESEAQLVARLEHLHIVPLYDYWRDPSGAFLVMRMLRGGSLEDKLHEGPWTVEAAAKLLDQVASALIVAHQNNVIHRDMKPANILLDTDLNAYLSDFGIAKDVGETNVQGDLGSMVGTPAYVSPEQIQGTKVTPQTDLYSLGLVMYELLAGQPAYQARNASALILQHMTEPIPDIRVIRPDLPPALNGVLQIATAKDPQNRFPSVLAFATAFRQAYEGRKNREADLQGRSGGTHLEDMIIFKPEFKPFRLDTTLLDLEALDAQLVNPYKGLRAFQETDSDDFFGRDALTDKLLSRLQEDHPGRRFLAVVGPSGSGKSSVVKAGVIPALRNGALENSENYFVAEMVPSTDALRELEGALLSIAINPPTDINQQLRSSTEGLQHVIEQILPPDGSELFLLIDQFEEVFTQTEDNNVRTHFMDMLQYAATNPHSRFRVVITIRADFFDKPLMYAEFGALVRERFEVVLPLNREELQQTIVGPAERVGARVQPELVEQIIDEVVAEPGALPLLQYALTELFERRTGRLLTLESYAASGGVLASLAKRAEDIYVDMNAERQEAIRQLFLRLVTLGEGTEDTRRRILWSELVFQHEEHDPLQDVLDTFGKYRLLTFDKDPQTREPTVEVAHEALIRQWTRLREWLRNSRDDVRAQRRLSGAVQEWRNANAEASFLASGSRLQQFEALLTSENIALTKDERDYVEASITRREAEHRAEEARKAREARLQRRARQFLIGLVVLMAIATVGALYLTREATLAQQEAERQAEIARLAQLEAENQTLIAERKADENYSLNLAQQASQISRIGDDAFRGIGLAMEANRVEDAPAEAQRTLGNVILQAGVIRRFYGHEAPLWRAIYSPDGQYVASGGFEPFGIIWDAKTGQELRRFGDNPVWIFDLAFSPDSQYVAAALQAGGAANVIMWEVATGEEVRSFGADGTGHLATTFSVTFTPDGKQLISVAEDADPTNNVIVWDVATGEIVQRLEGHTDSVIGVAVSPDGRYLATGGKDKAVILWDLTTGEEVRRFLGHESDVQAVDFNGDGSWVASGGADNQVVVWDVATGEAVFRFKDLPQAVRRVDFNATDTQLAAAIFGDSSLMVWGMPAGNFLYKLETHNALVTGINYSPDGKRMLSSGVEGVIEWDMDGRPALLGEMNLAVAAPLEAFALSHDEATLAAGLKDGTLQLVDAQTGEERHNITAPAPILSVAFTPDDAQVVLGLENGTVTLWDTGTGELVQTLTGHQAPVRAVATAGTLIAAGGGNILVSAERPLDNDILIWDATTGDELYRLEGHLAPVQALTFSPDTTQLISGADDGQIMVWAADTGALFATLKGHTDDVLSLAVSVDGTKLLSGSRDTHVIYWDLTTLSPLKTLRGHTSSVRGVGFSSDGLLALSSSGNPFVQGQISDNSLILWDLTQGEEIRRFNEHQSLVEAVLFAAEGSQAFSADSTGKILHWRIDNQTAFMDWVYANYEVPCVVGAEPNDQCRPTETATDETATEAPVEVAVVGQDEAATSTEATCFAVNPAPLAVDPVDTANFAKEGKLVLGFSNANNTLSLDGMIAAWAQAEAAQQANIQELVLLDAGGDYALQVTQIEELIAQGVDVLIVNPIEQLDMSAMETALLKAQTEEIPVVIVNRRLANTEAYTTFVGADDFKVGCLMMQELIALLDGEGNLAWFNGIGSTISDDNRKAGAAAAIALYPSVGFTDQVPTNLDAETIQRLMSDFINREVPLDGVWAYNGYVSLIANETLLEAGRAAVPVVGDAYLGLANYAVKNNVPSAQVHVPSSMGAEAIRVALQIRQGEAVPKFVEIPLEIITTDELAAFDLSQPAETMLGDFDGLPEEFIPQPTE